jgi:hypothetical protein
VETGVDRFDQHRSGWLGGSHTFLMAGDYFFQWLFFAIAFFARVREKSRENAVSPPHTPRARDSAGFAFAPA